MTRPIDQIARVSRMMRGVKGWSTHDVARNGGPSAATVSRIEQGTSDPTLATLAKLAHAYGIGTEHLFWIPTLVKPKPECTCGVEGCPDCSPRTPEAS